MKTYNMYSHPIYGMEAVKRGWSWPGFLFGIIWALCKKMWMIGFGTWGILFITLVATEWYSGQPAAELLTGMGGIIVSVWYGCEGNKMREVNLLNRNYKYTETIQSHNIEAALMEQLKRNEKPNYGNQPCS